MNFFLYPSEPVTTEIEPKIRHLACLKFDTSLSHLQHMHFFWMSVEYRRIFDVLSMPVEYPTQPWCHIFDSYLFESVTKILQKRSNI